MEHHRCRQLEAPPWLSRQLLGSKKRYAPDRSFDTIHVRIDLKVDFRTRTVSASCKTTLKAMSARVRKLDFQADGMRISAVRGQGGALKFRHRKGLLQVTLQKALRAGEETDVEIRYRLVRPKSGAYFIGPDKEYRGSPVQFWTQGQPEDSHFWFPCHDAPHEKATSETLITVPKGFRAVSNGILAEKTQGKGVTTYHWRMHHPHSLYLVSVAVGRFSEIKDRWEDIDITYYCEKGREEDARRGFGKTPKAMQVFSDAFGVRYPYEKYAQVAAAEFVAGGMENTTCTTQTDAVLITRRAGLDNDLDFLVAHELAHHWFGDLLTCRDWSHGWLNEGFATWCEVLFAEVDRGQDDADFELDRNARIYFDEDSRRYRRPLVSAKFKYPWTIFDRHLYEKGGWVVHMLRAELGDDAFFKSIRYYLIKFRNKSVETADLITSIEEATGRNLRRFFDQWVFGSGFPTFEAVYHWDRKAKRVEIRLKQTQSSGEKGAFKVPMKLRFTGPNGRWTKEFNEKVSKTQHVFRFKLPAEPAIAELDPEHKVLKKLEFRKPHALWLGQLKNAKSAVSRSHAAASVARWGGASAITALERSARGDRFWATAAASARALGTIGTHAAQEALLRLVSVRHPKVRRAAVESLAHFPNPKTAARVAGLITRDKSINVRAEAARTLGSVRDGKFIGSLKKGLGQRSWWDVVGAGAVQGLANTRDSKVLPLLKKAALPPTQFNRRGHAIRALGRFAHIDTGVVDCLSKSLYSRNERVLMAAIQTLGSIGDRRALLALRQAKKKHTDSRIKSYADEAIARILGEPESGKEDES